VSPAPERIEFSTLLYCPAHRVLHPAANLIALCTSPICTYPSRTSFNYAPCNLPTPERVAPIAPLSVSRSDIKSPCVLAPQSPSFQECTITRPCPSTFDFGPLTFPCDNKAPSRVPQSRDTLSTHLHRRAIFQTLRRVTPAPKFSLLAASPPVARTSRPHDSSFPHICRSANAPARPIHLRRPQKAPAIQPAPGVSRQRSIAVSRSQMGSDAEKALHPLLTPKL